MSDQTTGLYKMVIYFRDGTTAMYEMKDQEFARAAVEAIHRQSEVRKYAMFYYGIDQVRIATVNLAEVLHVDAKERSA